MLGRVETVEDEVSFTPVQILFREIEAGHARASERGADRKGTGVRECVEHFSFLRSFSKKRKAGSNVIDQKTTSVIALIEKQADRIAFIETEFVCDAVLLDLEKTGCRFAREELRRGCIQIGLSHLAGECFVVSAACTDLLDELCQPDALPGVERCLRLRKQKWTEAIDVPVGPFVGCAVD